MKKQWLLLLSFILVFSILVKPVFADKKENIKEYKVFQDGIFEMTENTVEIDDEGNIYYLQVDGIEINGKISADREKIVGEIIHDQDIFTIEGNRLEGEELYYEGTVNKSTNLRFQALLKESDTKKNFYKATISILEYEVLESALRSKNSSW